MITRTFKLCLNAGTGSAPYINVSQYDEGETWLFELYSETGERYIPTTGAIVGVKSDGHGIVNTGTVDSEGRVVITETQQMTASAGRAIYELSIDGLTHGTANFIVAVERKPTDDAVMSDSDLSLIQEAIDSAEVIVEVIGDGDPSEVIGEHVDAWLDNHPEATTTVQDGAITAPKINNSLWDKLLVSEEASGAVASFDDGADDVPVSSLKVNLEPIQTGSGDPSPSNVRPIIEANGKNLFNESLFETYTETIIYTSYSVANGTYIMSGDLPFDANTANVFFLTGSVTTGANTTNNGVYLNRPITLSVTDGHYTVAYRSTGSNTKNPKDYHFQIERGSSASAYQPYQGIMVEQTGKNLLDASTFINKPWNADTVNNARARPTKAIVVPVGSVITLSVSSDFLSKYVYAVLQMDKNFPASSTVGDSGWRSVAVTTVTMASQYLGINIKRIDNGDVDLNDLKNMQIQVEYGSTATEYVPFVEGASYPYTLGQSVYGGTVDLATGVLTVTWGTITLDGSESWQGTPSSGWYTALHTLKKYKTSYIGVIYADKLATGRVQGSISGYYDNNNTYPAQNWLYYYNNTLTTPSEVKSYFQTNPTQIVYELATPQTINLTPTQVKTLLGYNNISSSGTVDVIYHADTKLYVDKMTAVDNNIIAPTEETFTATRNYTVNDLLIINNVLYKVTANIANGGTITVNTNVQQTTLGALIKALS